MDGGALLLSVFLILTVLGFAGGDIYVQLSPHSGRAAVPLRVSAAVKCQFSVPPLFFALPPVSMSRLRL